MRWRPKVSLRLLMILIALVAAAICSEITRRRWVAYSGKAAEYAKLEQDALRAAAIKDAKVIGSKREAEGMRSQARRDAEYPELRRVQEEMADLSVREAELAAQEAEEYRVWAADYGRRKSKYQRAAARPWFSVEPDSHE